MISNVPVGRDDPSVSDPESSPPEIEQTDPTAKYVPTYSEHEESPAEKYEPETCTVPPEVVMEDGSRVMDGVGEVVMERAVVPELPP